MKAIYKAPGRDPQRVEIANELGVLQQIVGGYIEPVRILDDTVLICNEDGKNLGLDKNFYLDAIRDTIVGPVLFVGEDGEEFSDIPERDADLILRIFEGWEGGARA